MIKSHFFVSRLLFLLFIYSCKDNEIIIPLVFPLVVYLLVANEFIRTFYVSASTGNNFVYVTQAKHQTTLWETIQKAVNYILGGDTIVSSRNVSGVNTSECITIALVTVFVAVYNSS